MCSNSVTNLSRPFLLKEALPNTIITNYAADGYTSDDVLEGYHWPLNNLTFAGTTPSISRQARDDAGDPFPDSQHFAPLSHLEALENVSHALLSVGGKLQLLNH